MIEIKKINELNSLGNNLSDIQLNFLFKVIRRRIQSKIDKLTLAMIRAIRKQEKEVINNLSTIVVATKRNLKKVIVPFDMDKWIIIIADVMKPIIFEGAKDGYIAGGVPVKSFGTGYLTNYTEHQKATLASGIGFRIDNENIQDWLNNYTIKFSKFINADIADNFNVVVKNGISEGFSLKKIEELVAEAYTPYSVLPKNGVYGAWKARRVALTSMVGAQNSGHLASLKDSGVVQYKAWLSARNVKVRDTHKQADKRYTRDTGIPLDENFNVGGAWLSSPGVVISGDVGEAISCHCALMAARKGKATNAATKPKAIQLNEVSQLPTIKRSITI